MFAFWFELKHKLNLCLWRNTFREKKWRELFKSKRWEELSSLSFMKRRLFGPTLQFQSSFRCLTLMLSCFSSCVMCFLFFPRRKKKCCAISWFFFFPFSWGMLKWVNDFCYSDNLHMKSFVPKWDMCRLKKKGRLHRQNDWQLKLEGRLWWCILKGC